MAIGKRHLGFLCCAFGILTLQWGCTDGREPAVQPLMLQASTAPQSFLTARSDIQYQGQSTNVLAMAPNFGNLYVTGFPNFAFAGWDISANPESPQLLFAAGTEIDIFAGGNPWTVDAFGSGAIGILGNYAFTSGTAGMTVIDISQATQPRVVEFHPPPNATTGEINQDLGFVWSAIAAHPTLPLIYGFAKEDYVYTVSVTNGAVLQSRQPYANGGAPVCCVKSAVVFNGYLFVAFQSQLTWFPMTSSGVLSNPGVMNQLQATNVAATANYLYVHHDPNNGQPQGQQYRRGFYVFDNTGNMVNFIPTSFTPQVFAVSPGDTDILANVDGTQVVVYYINWNTNPSVIPTPTP